MNNIEKDIIYTDGNRDVVVYEIDEARATVIFDVIQGPGEGNSDISSTTLFKKNFKKV